MSPDRDPSQSEDLPREAEQPLVSRAERPAEPPAVSADAAPRRARPGSGIQRLIVRLVATCGIVGIGVAIAAIMRSSGSQGWLIGLVVSLVSVVLAAVLWSSRQL